MLTVKTHIWTALVALALSLLVGCTAETKATSDATTTTDPDTSTGTDTTTSTEPDTSDPDTSPGGCTKHSDCKPQGTDFVCGKGGVCVDATTDLCILEAGSGGVDDNTVLIGVMSPKTFEDGILLYIEKGILMAQGEVNSSRLPGNKKIGIVSCNDQIENEDAEARPWLTNADHLANKIGVPVIIGPAFSGIYVETYQEVTKEAGVVTISMSATSPAITDLDIGEEELVWRVVPSDVAQAAAMANLVEVRAPERALIFVKDDPYGRGLREPFLAQFAAQITSQTYKVVEYAPNTNADGLRSLVNSEFNAAYNMVIFLSTDEAGTLFKTYEDRTIVYNDSNPPIAPTYLFSEGGKDSSLATIKSYTSAATQLSLLSRMEGTQPDTRNLRRSIYDTFAASYVSKYGEQPGVFSSTSYDALYVVFYAMCTVSTDKAITPSDIVLGFKKLGSGTLTEPGATKIPAARLTLQGGGSIDYDGASGEIKFDAKGDVEGLSFTRWTIQNRGSDTAPDLRFLEDQGSYSVAADAWTFPPAP